MQGVAVLLNHWPDGGCDFFNHGRDVEVLQEQLHLPCFDLRKVEDVVDEG